jgi:hypothetical protein
MDLIKTDFQVLDERFGRVNGDEWMQRLHTGCRWTEGPAYFPAGRYLVFSDIPTSACSGSPRGTRTGTPSTVAAGSSAASRVPAG